MFPAASSMWSQMSSRTLASSYMSSRSKGVTNVRLSRSTTSRVSRSPTCSSSLMSRSSPSPGGNASSSSTSRRAISTVFRAARLQRTKNSRFCGTSETTAREFVRSPGRRRGGRRRSRAARGRVRGVRELAKLGREEVCDLLADVDGVVADALERPGDKHHAQPVLAHRLRFAELEDALDDSAIRTVDELVQRDKRLGCLQIAVGERVERDADHLLAARAHLVGELVVSLLERVERAAEGPKNEGALLVQGRLEQVEVLLESRSHPKRPVT